MLAFLSAALGTGGCTTLGFAVAGPLFTGVAAIADRSVEKTIPADQATTWGVTVDALNRMAVRLEETDKSGERWLLKGTGGAVTVHGVLDRMTSRMTKVSIRVEAGGLLADKKTGDEILNQISASLASLDRPTTDAARPSSPDLAADRLGTLQREIERLSTKLDEAKNASLSTSTPPSAPVPSSTGAGNVVVIPVSAGVPTIPVSASASVPELVPVVVRARAAAREEVPRSGDEPRVHQQDLADHILPAILEPVGVLSPVPALSAGRAGQ
jgi:hypothetical protein